MSNPMHGLDVNQYLERIGYTGPIVNSAYMLARLQEQHVHTVPYENLDILHQIPLSLDIPDLYDKIVTRHRGGYCFELNALFGWLLQELGFKVTHYFGRFWRDETDTPAKRRHHILQVDIEDQRYIADVGVGGAGPRHPLELVDGLEQTQGNETYRLVQTEAYGWMLEEWKKEAWDPVFSFTEEPNLPRDFITTSFWCEYAPDSPFNKTARVSIRTAEGRNTVDDDEFRIYKAGGVHTFKPGNAQEYAEALYTYFGIPTHK
ncbi:arylamine N-acetyltransferase [Paenibacillus lautus]|uniref:arylamine N-acetyltransferase family protein n=1 Tax=Paenibacillus lautus TaxID=1401 RepID=UPI002DBB5D87|nr:arylamine N-acetyltransferase [Paenibacillus lautus]MEC0206889.1 arylamine N-acetyltransferase [Paenibacillus lautus]